MKNGLERYSSTSNLSSSFTLKEESKQNTCAMFIFYILWQLSKKNALKKSNFFRFLISGERHNSTRGTNGLVVIYMQYNKSSNLNLIWYCSLLNVFNSSSDTPFNFLTPEQENTFNKKHMKKVVIVNDTADAMDWLPFHLIHRFRFMNNMMFDICRKI